MPLTEISKNPLPFPERILTPCLPMDKTTLIRKHRLCLESTGGGSYTGGTTVKMYKDNGHLKGVENSSNGESSTTGT